MDKTNSFKYDKNTICNTSRETELEAQLDTYIRLTNIYKNISKDRLNSKIVVSYINELEQKLEIAKKYLDIISRGFHFGDDIEGHLKILAGEALQQMKEVKTNE